MSDQLSLFSSPSYRVVVFDLETLRSAAEVGGWNNIHRMGMACAVVYDSLTQQYEVYEEKDVEKLIAHLQSADLVVGFNHLRFDYRVLSGYAPVDLGQLNNFDILDDVSRLLGHRLSLQVLVSATLMESKSANGMESLRWVKEGKMDLVKEYCKKDVEVTRALFEHGTAKKCVRYQDNEGVLKEISVEWDVHTFITSYRDRINRTPAR